MPLEASMLCVDNSDYSRNGDFSPSRLDSQIECVNLLANSKVQEHPESSVGLMTMSGRPEVLRTLTNEPEKLMSCFRGVTPHGSVSFVHSIQVAALALKHRKNKVQRQRIIAFVGSPLDHAEKELVTLAKRLKKTNVSVDVINFGQELENVEKLEAFINAVNNKEGSSHLVSVPSGPNVSLSDSLISSPLMAGESGVGGAGGASGGGGGQFEFGIDPSLDPELALALRVSLEEERQRQERARAEAGGADAATETSGTAAAGSGGGDGASATETNKAEQATAATAAAPAAMDDEQALLQQALAMSMGYETAPPPAAATQPMDVDEMSLEAQLELAKQLSMASGDAAETPKDASEGDKKKEQDSGDAATGSNNLSDVINNPEFLSSVLGSLPGVDPNDEQFKDLLKKKDGEDKEDDGK